MIYLLTFLLLLALELIYFRIANRFDIIDKPNMRSSHTRITLRGGGIIFPVTVLIWFVLNGFQYGYFIGGLTLISLVSFADDVKPLSSRLRLPMHFAAMLLMFVQLDLFNAPWWFFIIALVFCTGTINAYNFMDGINGITASYSISLVLAMLYINNRVVPFVDANLLIILLIGLVVFSFFNFRKKARCFAGDVGSVSIAFILVFLLGLLILKTRDLSYVMLLTVYGVDSVLTIVHRLMLKENVSQPHRKHAYQLLANELKWPHLAVSSFYAVLQLSISAGLFYFESNKLQYMLVVFAVLSLSYVLFKRKYFYLHQQKN